MRRTLFETIYYEEFITVDMNKTELIEKMSQMQNIEIYGDTSGRELAFYVNKRGTFFVDSPQKGTTSRPGRNYILKGKVIASKNNTSNIYFCYTYIRFWLLGLLTLFFAVFLPFVLIFGLTWKLLFLLPVTTIPFLIYFLSNSNNELNKHADFEIMKKNVIRKIDAALNWDK